MFAGSPAEVQVGCEHKVVPLAQGDAQLIHVDIIIEAVDVQASQRSIAIAAWPVPCMLDRLLKISRCQRLRGFTQLPTMRTIYIFAVHMLDSVQRMCSHMLSTTTTCNWNTSASILTGARTLCAHAQKQNSAR